MSRSTKLSYIGIDLFADMERILILGASTTRLWKSVRQNDSMDLWTLLTRRDAAGGHMLSVRG